MLKSIKRRFPRRGTNLPVILILALSPMHASLKEACALRERGEYRQSLQVSHGLLLKKLSYFDRGRNYFSMARIYAEYGLEDKAEYYFEKAASRKNQYYLYIYAKFEENRGDYLKAKALYDRALAMGAKTYIQNAYNRMLHRAAVKDEYFMEYLDDSVKSKIIKNALIIR